MAERHQSKEHSMSIFSTGASFTYGDTGELCDFVTGLQAEAARARTAGDYHRARAFEAEVDLHLAEADAGAMVEVRSPQTVEEAVESFIEEMADMDAVDATYGLSSLAGWF